ncbi:MAG: DUF3486 family protein [Zoogloeaceae bacterium]|jgi:phosphoenolpyruvate-protein kinase (PTS system EI component)|nr:DUF3486 family protein [Zoogloeaceae bacterium]
MTVRRSKVSQLPKEIQDQLNARLVGSGFSNYRGLVKWLAEQGFDISRSALHQHGSALEEEFKAAIADARRTRELARAAKETGEDESGELMQAASEIIQDNLLRLSLKAKAEVDTAETKLSADTMATLSHAFANVGRFDLSRRKWQAEVRKRLDALEKDCARKGRPLDAATLNAIRDELYG